MSLQVLAQLQAWEDLVHTQGSKDYSRHKLEVT